MSWNSYVDRIIKSGLCKDAAIVGCRDKKYTWACHGPDFKEITAAQIDTLLSRDRTDVLINGVTLGAYKCSVIRDGNENEECWIMDLRTKNSDCGTTVNLSIGKTLQALVIAVGNDGIGGGLLNPIVHKMVKYLQDNNF
ncbi:profilin-2-like [Stigmatopora nigra]